MLFTYPHTEVNQAKAKALELSHNTKIWVLEGCDKERSTTIIEVVDHPINSTIVSGFTLATYLRGKEVSIQ